MNELEIAKIIYNHLHKLLPPNFDSYFNKILIVTINALVFLNLPPIC